MTNVASFFCHSVAIVAVVAAAATGPVAERTIVVFGPFSSLVNLIVLESIWIHHFSVADHLLH